MSGLSLREQLLQAGLVTEKQARQAEQQQKRHVYQGTRNVSKRDREQRAAAQAAEQQKAAAAKAARDLELNRKREDKAAAKARWAEIRQIVEQHRITKPESDDYYNFVLGKKIGRVAVDAALRARIVRAEVAVVRCDGRYELLPADAAERVREREPRAVVPAGGATSAAPVEDDDYKDYVVPDDLIW
jgi:uncharacterized protein YaiL (DUF2058 family)